MKYFSIITLLSLMSSGHLWANFEQAAPLLLTCSNSQYPVSIQANVSRCSNSEVFVTGTFRRSLSDGGVAEIPFECMPASEGYLFQCGTNELSLSFDLETSTFHYFDGNEEQVLNCVEPGPEPTPVPPEPGPPEPDPTPGAVTISD